MEFGSCNIIPSPIMGRRMEMKMEGWGFRFIEVIIMDQNFA